MTVPELEVRDSLRDPDSSDRTDRTAQWRNPESDKPLYRVFLYLEGDRLPYVNAVTYVLHPTFREPTRQVYRTLSNPRCKLELWTWGLFRVQAIVADSDGNMLTLTHDLQYDKEFPDFKFAAA
jgi:transcription initiation factor IIF auxiliary subunit